MECGFEYYMECQGCGILFNYSIAKSKEIWGKDDTKKDP